MSDSELSVSEPPQPDFLVSAIQRLSRGATLAEFTAWYAEAHADLFMPGALARMPDAAAAAEEARRVAGLLAREIWRRTPDPARGWQPRPLPTPGRNDPCFCGSGRKFKQCCQALAVGAPPLELDTGGLAALLFAEGPLSWRTPQALQAMPGDMLLGAAHGWSERHGAAAVVELLEPLFRAPAKLAARHADAFDALVDALLELDRDRQRGQLVRNVAEQAVDRVLRGVAQARLAALAADRGDHDGAWSALRQAQHDTPDDPNLLHLELALLLAAGREDEARLRAPLLAARARRLGLADYARHLQDLAARGVAALADVPDDETTSDEEQQAWIALLREPLAHLQLETFVQTHDITCDLNGAEGELRIVPKPALRRRLKPWLTRFAPAVPMMTTPAAEADALLDEAEAARAWLQRHRDVVASVPVLDGLLIAARVMTRHSDSPAVLHAAGELAFAAAEMVEAVLTPWPQARLQWVDMDNRPVLRIVSQAITLALELADEERAEHWLRWILERNPNDNHGWRGHLRTLLLRRGDAAGALAVLEAYPDEAPPSGHDRALALYLLGRTDEAAAVLRQAHQEGPAFVPVLLPEAVDRPPQESPPGRIMGSTEQAWHWRADLRPAWVRSGALEWLRGLGLPDPAAAEAGKSVAVKAPRKKAAKKPARVEALADGTIPATQAALLRRRYGARLPWLLGWLAANAWAPGLVMPTLWAQDAIAAAAGEEDGGGLQGLVEAVMNQYNAFNEQRLDAAGAAAPVPLPVALPEDDDAAWAGFAAGFVQAAEKHAAGVWRAAGATVSSRKPPFAALYQLAAQAPPGPDGWRASADTGQPLLGLAQDQPPARELLVHALQPLWRLALASRR